MNKIKSTIPIRKYTGEHWKTNHSNKQRLVIDFESKCAYCDDHHKYSGGYNSYHVEHFAPKEKFKHLEFNYENLLYSCPYCNIAKSDKWVGKTEYDNIVGDKGFADPCSPEYNNHLSRNTDGSIKYNTYVGKYMYHELKLYLKRHEIINNLEKINVKRKKLKEKIDEMQAAGKQCSQLEDIHKCLCEKFCTYYDCLSEDYDS